MSQPQRQVILIGGAPTTGKSTMARALAQKLALSWISTDQLRSLVKVHATPQAQPLLYDTLGYTVERFFETFAIEEIAQRELDQAEAVWPGVKVIIEDEYDWKEGVVIEGVNIVPHLVARDYAANPLVKAVFLVDDDEARIRKVVYTRGLWDYADTYTNDVKDKEVAWVRVFSQKLKKEADECGLPWVEIQKNAHDLDQVCQVVHRPPDATARYRHALDATSGPEGCRRTVMHGVVDSPYRPPVTEPARIPEPLADCSERKPCDSSPAYDPAHR